MIQVVIYNKKYTKNAQNTHHFNYHFPDKPGLASCPLDSQYPVILILSSLVQTCQKLFTLFFLKYAGGVAQRVLWGTFTLTKRFWSRFLQTTFHSCCPPKNAHRNVTECFLTLHKTMISTNEDSLTSSMSSSSPSTSSNITLSSKSSPVSSLIFAAVH